MSRPGKVDFPTPTEILATVARSAFPSLITEGRDDVIVWRRFEDVFDKSRLTLIPAGGKDAVLEVFKRRDELRDKSFAMFIADLDQWIFTGIRPDKMHERLIFTSGYSVENDMFSDGEMLNLLVGAEREGFARELEEVLDWYALAVDRGLRGVPVKIDVHPNELLDDPARKVALTRLLLGEVYPVALRQRIAHEPFRYLRGKTLFGLLTRHATSFNSRSLLNLAAARNGPEFKRVEEALRSQLRAFGAA